MCKKIIGIIFIVMVSISWGYSCIAERESNSQAEKLLTKAQVREDREQVIQYLEGIHPFFLMEKDQGVYEAAKKEYKKETGRKMTLYEFQEATSAYLSSINDAHTGIAWEMDEEFPVLQLEQIYEDGKTYVCKNGKKTDIWVKEIGGIKTEAIYQKVEQLFSEENESARIKNREFWTLIQNVLKSCNVDIENNRVELLFSDGSKKECPFGEMQIGKKDYGLGKNRGYIEDDIFVVDFNSCIDDENLQEIAEELRKTVNDGCTKVIIDARGNAGGDTEACKRLLNAIGMYPEEASSVVFRYSPWAAKERGYGRKEGVEQRSFKTQTVCRNENVNLVVLSDRVTFSSATSLCVWVRDGNLGTIIGEPSANKPNSYGDILVLTLKNSKLTMVVSHKFFVRPDSSNKEDMLLPDIETSADEAYAEAVRFLRQKEN